MAAATASNVCKFVYVYSMDIRWTGSPTLAVMLHRCSTTMMASVVRKYCPDTMNPFACNGRSCQYDAFRTLLSQVHVKCCLCSTPGAYERPACRVTLRDSQCSCCLRETRYPRAEWPERVQHLSIYCHNLLAGDFQGFAIVL